MSVRNFDNEIHTLKDTPFGYTMQLISGKWKMVILYLLAEQEKVRYNRIREYIGTISDKTLTEQLRQMEADGLITRIDRTPTIREYTLTGTGRSLVPIIEELCYWGVDHMSKDS
jgi:DNA-binding HxlR family transcriptional regulator